MKNHTVPVIVEEELSGKKMFPSTGTLGNTIKDMNYELLAESFDRIITNMNKLIDSQNSNECTFKVDQVVINLNIKANVGFALIGTLSGEASGAVQVILKPNN